MINLDHLDDLYQSTTPGRWQLIVDNIAHLGPCNTTWITTLHAAWPELHDELKQLREENAALHKSILRVSRNLTVWLITVIMASWLLLK